MKLLTRGAVVVLALLAVAAVALWLNLAHLVKTAVEREGTLSLRLPTTLSSARVSVLGGRVGLRGFSIGSPRGFDAPKMLEADDVRVTVRYRELRRRPIHVGTLEIEKPKLILEQSGGVLNFRKAMQLLPERDPNQPPMKLVIDRLEVRDAQVVIRPGLPGVQREIVVEVPALSMKDIGRGEGARNGAAIRDVALRVMAALAEKAAQSGALPGELQALLHLDAGKIGADVAGKALQELLPAGRSPPRR